MPSSTRYPSTPHPPMLASNSGRASCRRGAPAACPRGVSTTRLLLLQLLHLLQVLGPPSYFKFRPRPRVRGRPQRGARVSLVTPSLKPCACPFEEWKASAIPFAFRHVLLAQPSPSPAPEASSFPPDLPSILASLLCPCKSAQESSDFNFDAFYPSQSRAILLEWILFSFRFRSL